MAPDEWTALVKDLVQRIADRDYQQRSWFGHGPEISSPDEMLCGIFDDLNFATYIESKEVGLTDTQRSLGRSLGDALDAFSAQTSEKLDPVQTIDSPAWDKVRRVAREFARSFEQTA